ncbi:DUF4242 domain-containing protein [Tumidithrix helvetica PCC 7403]|uniref:DUF4242 domain-containing protein n=1 Tax=Tumidithrix helvetica TaxID=3457545 RepID=UPI003C8346A3
MSLVIVETLSDSPLILEELTDPHSLVLKCLAERNATWRYSLLSSDRHRMICTFEAPDAESVRESYRKGGGFFSHIWSGELMLPESDPPLHDDTSLKIFEVTFSEGLTQEQWDEANRHVLPCYAERGVEWVQSYVSRDRTRVVCELNAPDAEAIREAHRKAGVPCDRVWSALLIKP